MKIRDLPVGTRFRYEFGRTAKLISLTPMGATVRFDRDARHEAFVAETADGPKDVAFSAPGKPRLVSDASEVEVIP